MISSMMTVDRYLHRIGYEGSQAPVLATLDAVQKAHLTSVPYENLDLLYRRPCSLATEALYDKIVNRRRGGYCFELNGLFAWLLRQMGFQVTEFFGRWLIGEPLAMPKRRHRILRVDLPEGRFLADAGVGRVCPLTPLCFEPDVIQEREGVRYRILADPLHGWLVQVESEQDFINFYSFTEEPQQAIDFAYPHYYCATHPDSPFLVKTLVHLLTPQGRNSVVDAFDPETGMKARLFRIGQGEGQVREFLARTEEEFFAGLRDYFGIDWQA
jgi:N-hydroxyarylamine O-acetyltransferase